MADSDQIQAVIRVRPLIQREQQGGQAVQWNVKDDKVISQRDQPSAQSYIFDKIFDRECTTWDLYSEAIAPIVEAAMNGFHGTIFAYGQSGSGKTYTMSGDKMTPGVISQAMNDIFDFIEQKPTHEFLMRASYMEIYNEKIYDLLSKEDKHLKLQETVDHQINVIGLEEKLVSSCQQVLRVIQAGEAKRTFAETKQNDRSSRSHCIFRIIIESRQQNEVDAAVMVSHLNFVDLAGSEKAGDNSGDRLREGCSINMSLFCLSNVISKLSEGVSNQFISYRDSKLTRILQNALGGNSKTVIVATINPTTVEESHSTLRFATRAKTIKNKPHVNEVLSDAAMLKKYRNEITRLNKIVTEMGVTDMQTAHEDLKKQLDEKQQLIKDLTRQIVSSSSLMTADANNQKKKLRRVTWCAPKVRRKSFFPSLTPTDRSFAPVCEETDLDVAFAQGEGLDLPLTTIVPSLNDHAKAKAFQRRSDEMVSSNSFFETPLIEEMGDSLSGKDTAEVMKLQEEIMQLKEKHMEEVDKLHERIKQLEFEQAVEADHKEENEKKTMSDQEEVNKLKQQIEDLLYNRQIAAEESKYLKTALWHAEEENKRLSQEVIHLTDERFDLNLEDLEQLERAKCSLEVEMKQLVATLQDKDKEIASLQKALAGQEPYVARLEQQLEMYMGAGSGQLGTEKKRRSGIPVPVRTADTNKEESSGTDTEVTAVEAVEQSASAENLQEPAANTDRMMVADVAHDSSSPSCEVYESSSSEQCKSETRATAETANPATSDMTKGWNVNLSNISCLSAGDVFIEDVLTDVSHSQSRDEGPLTPKGQNITGTGAQSVESSTKLATRLKRRSDSNTSMARDMDSELYSKLKTYEQEIEQLSSERSQLLETMNQAKAEAVRCKEAMNAIEKADAERMDELSEIPKLRSLLSRRDMEIQRLETLNDRLKEELSQQALNSSLSSLSSSFTERSRKSFMLKERETEIWQLKDQLVQYAKRLDDVQQEKINLEGMVVDLQNQPTEGTEEEGDAGAEKKENNSPPGSVTSSESACQLNVSVESTEDRATEAESSQITVTAEELEAVQRLLSDKDSAISSLKHQLQMKEEEMEQMFDGQMLIPSDVIQTHLQRAEDQTKQIEELKGQLKAREEELAKLEARAEVQRSSTGSQDDAGLLEQLIMDKMTLEETLQEKTEALACALEEKANIQVLLDERRMLVNELQQKNEDMMDELLLTQKQFIDFQKKLDEEQCQAPSSFCQDSNQPPVEGKEQTESSEMSFKTNDKQEATDDKSEPIDESYAKESMLEDSFEVTFKITDSEEMLPEHEKSRSVLCSETHTADESDANASALIVNDDEMKQTSQSEALPVNDGQMRQTSVFDSEERPVSESEVISVNDAEMRQTSESEALSVSEMKQLAQGKALSVSGESMQTSDCHQQTEVDTLEMQISGVSVEVETLKTEITILKSDNETIQTEKTALEKRVQAMDAEYMSLQTKIQENEELQSQLAQLSEERDAQAEKLQELMQVSDLSEKVETLKTEIAILKSDNETIQTEKSALEKIVQAMNIECKSLQTKIQEGEELQSQLTKLHAERDAQTEKLQEVMQVSDLSTEVETLKTEITILKSDNDTILAEKSALEKTVQAMDTECKSLQTKIQESEELQSQLTKTCDERDAHAEKIQKLISNVDELRSALEQKQSDNEELGAELTWQTKENEQLQHKVDELEADVGVLIQDLEKAQKLQESSEDCQRVVEDTLDNLKIQNAKLEDAKKALATERDELELKEEAACRERDRLRLELEVTTDQLKDKISSLELELETAVQQKAIQDAALNDKEYAQEMQEQLNKKLCTDLQESQTEVSTMKTALSQLQAALQSKDNREVSLKKIIVSLEGEREQWTELKLSLEADSEALKEKLLKAEQGLQTSKQDLQVLQQECSRAEKAEEAMTALQTEVNARDQEIQCLQAEIQSVKTEKDANSSEIVQLQRECGEVKETCKLLQRKVSELEAQYKQAEQESQQLANDLQKMKESSAEAGKMIPILEAKKQKFVLKNRIVDLTRQLNEAKTDREYFHIYMEDMKKKLAKYEKEEEEEEDREDKMKMLEDSVKAKDMELAGVKMDHRQKLMELNKKLGIAEDTVNYKEQVIKTLKGEIRRIRSQEVSFCADAPTTKPSTPGSSRTSADQHVLSKCGILDSYTVNLLEADKLKLKKELQKTRDHVNSLEAELHWAKVALAKSKGSCSAPSPPPVDAAQPVTPQSDGTLNGSKLSVDRRPDDWVGQRLGTPVDSIPIRGGSVAKVLLPREDTSLPHCPASAGGTSVDLRKDRLVLPSAMDKENSPLVSAKHFREKVDSAADSGSQKGESPLNIEPEFWKKPRMPQPSLYKSSSSRTLQKVASEKADECKTQ